MYSQKDFWFIEVTRDHLFADQIGAVESVKAASDIVSLFEAASEARTLLTLSASLLRSRER